MTANGRFNREVLAGWNRAALLAVRLPMAGTAATVVLTVALATFDHRVAGADNLKAAASAGDAELFDRLDVNHDGALRGDEVRKENQSLFGRLVRRGDANHDHALSREEFIAALVPSRPPKQLEEKEPATLPGANAVRYLLLTMDANRNARIEKSEVPGDLQAAYEAMSERLDRNQNGALERQELSRGGPAMSAVAMRYVARLGIDVDAELAKLKQSQGAAIDRFEQQPVPLQNLKSPQQAKELFAQFDENADGKLDPREVPPPVQQPMERLVRLGDRDRDGKLTEAEFVAATQQIAKLLQRRPAVELPKRDVKAERKAAKEKNTPADK